MKIFRIFLIVLGIGYAGFCLAEMKSQNFGITADTVNSGGDPATSQNFGMNDSLGEAATGEERSANYKSKTAFWYMMPDNPQLSVDCQSENVYMIDYTLGNADNYNKYLFSSSQKCDVIDNSSAPWSLTMRADDLVSSKNTLPNENVYLVTDGNPALGETVTDPVTGINESAGNDHTLNTDRTVITGDVSANGVYSNRPTIKLTNLNNFYSESLSGTITITIQ